MMTEQEARETSRGIYEGIKDSEALTESVNLISDATLAWLRDHGGQADDAAREMILWQVRAGIGSIIMAAVMSYSADPDNRA